LYRALTSATCELQWLTFLLEEFKIDFQHPTVLYHYNRSTLYIAVNLAFHDRTKHIEIDGHIVHGKMLNGLVKLLCVFSANQLTYIYTKALMLGAFSVSAFQARNGCWT